MFAFFSALCLYGKASHEAIIEAMLEIDAEFQQPFYSLVHVIRTERDREVISSAMMLVNAILAGEKEIGAREKLRYVHLVNAEKLGITKFNSLSGTISFLTILFLILSTCVNTFPEKSKLLFRLSIFGDITKDEVPKGITTLSPTASHKLRLNHTNSD